MYRGSVPHRIGQGCGAALGCQPASLCASSRSAGSPFPVPPEGASDSVRQRRIHAFCRCCVQGFLGDYPGR
eukprot:123418-Lingulodinium_polyedra.AAC.1